MKWPFVLVVAAVVCSTGQSAMPQVPAFDHVVVVVLENKERGKVLGNSNAPAFNAFECSAEILERLRLSDAMLSRVESNQHCARLKPQDVELLGPDRQRLGAIREDAPSLLFWHCDPDYRPVQINCRRVAPPSQ